VCLGLKALFCGVEVTKHPIYSIRPKMIFGSVSKHFAILRHVKRCKTCVLGLNALFRGTDVAKHPFYYIRPKMIFGSVSKHFTILGHVKRCKTCAYTTSGYRCCEASTLLHLIQIDVWECFGAVSKVRNIKRCNTSVSGMKALFLCIEVATHPFYSSTREMMFGSVLDHFANIRT
jgi:hypothetical protein